MIDPLMMAGLMGGMGGGAGGAGSDPDAMKRMFMLQMLLKPDDKSGGHAGGVAQLGKSLMAGMLMNKGMNRNGVQFPEMHYGFENLFAGRPWNSPPGGAPT